MPNVFPPVNPNAPSGMVGFWPATTVPVSGAVADMSGNGNNLIYSSASMNDTTRDTAAGYFSSAAGTNPNWKSFLVPQATFQPNVNGNSDSFFVSTVVNLAADPGTFAIMGNAGDLGYAGFVIYTQSTTFVPYIKATGTTNLGGSAAFSLNTDYRLTVYVDGPTKRAFAWLNGTMFVNNYDVSALGSFLTAGNYWGFGNGGGPLNTYGGWSQAVKFKDATIMWMRSGGYLRSPAYLDWLLRTRPSYQITNLDIAR